MILRCGLPRSPVRFAAGEPDDGRLSVSRHRYWMNIHDLARDAEHQLAIPRRVFNAMAAEGWRCRLLQALGLGADDSR